MTHTQDSADTPAATAAATAGHEEPAALRAFIHAPDFFAKLHDFCAEPAAAELDWLKATVSKQLAL